MCNYVIRKQFYDANTVFMQSVGEIIFVIAVLIDLCKQEHIHPILGK